MIYNKRTLSSRGSPLILCQIHLVLIEWSAFQFCRDVLSVTADIPYPLYLSFRVCDPITAKSTEGFRRIGVGVLRKPSVLL